jgi:hypothetical protein
MTAGRGLGCRAWDGSRRELLRAGRRSDLGRSARGGLLERLAQAVTQATNRTPTKARA